MQKIAVIGSGLAAITFARKMKKHAKVTLFEKARGVSGRMSTRRADPYHFDHGAQFFTAKTEEFQSFIAPLIDKNIIEIWKARFVEFEGREIVSARTWDKEYPHYVGVPAMNKINKYLCEDLDVKVATRVSKLQRKDDLWLLYSEDGSFLGEYDWVVSSAPAEQSTELFPDCFSHYKKISSTKMLACFSLMLGYEIPLNLEFDAALVRDKDISWISINSTKPQRSNDFTMLVHSTNKWAEEHIDDDKEEVIKYLIDQTSETTGVDLNGAIHKTVHGWRYANIGKQEYNGNLIDKESKLAVCGDWLIMGRVECAFESANNLSKEFIELYS